MILYFSARILQAQASGGIVGYFLGLIRALAKKPGLQIHVGLVPLNFHELGDHLPENVTRHHLPCLQNELWATKERALIGQLRPDWVVYSYPDELDTYSTEGAFRTAVCIPDLQHLSRPAFFPANARLSRDIAFGKALGSADFIFTLSKYGKEQIVATYGCEEELVKIIHPAAAPRFLEGPASAEKIAAAKKRFDLPERYAIYPGNFWPHKNHKKLLEAFSLLRQRGVSIPLVLTGTQSFADAGLQKQITRAKNEGWLHVPGYVTGDELHALVSGAGCLVFPSLFEGFGIPVAEALATGVRVACSDVCSLPEVGGDVARYFDPEDAEAISAVVEKIWNHPAPGFEKMAHSQTARFDYDRSAAEFLNALANVKKRTAPPGYHAIQVREPVLVSIVTPSYQQGEFLRQCIESVLTQDYPHIEYMVMDGGSTDESRRILESYGDRFFWKSGRDGGQTCAINEGLRRAHGGVLAYLNSDDILLPGAISSVVEEWSRRPSVDLFYGRANMIDREGTVMREYDTREFHLPDFKGHCYICQPAAFWHRRVVDRLGCMDENFQTAMDYEYWQRIAANGGLLVKLDRLLACSRDYETTKTRSQRGKVFDDVFRSQLLHWGRIHPLWWRGWLDYMKMERPGIHQHFIPPAKKSERLSVALSKLVRKWEPARMIAPARLSGLMTRARKSRESGYYADGWAGTAFRMPLHVRQESRIYIEGMSPAKKEFRMLLRGGRTETVKVEAGAMFRHEWTLKPGRYLLKIDSPASIAAGDDRPLGFLIHATNVFAFR